MEAAFLLGKSGHEPWSETAISPEPSPSAKSLLGLHLSGAAFGYNCPGAVSPSWHEHYVSARPPGLQVLEVWNNSTLRELPNTQPSVQAKDKALLQPSLRGAHGTVISAKNTGAFPFTHAEVPATKVITESEEIFIFYYFLSTQIGCYLCSACSSRGTAAGSTHEFFTLHLYLPPHQWHLSNLLFHLCLI